MLKNKYIRLSFFLDLFFKEKIFPSFYACISNAILNETIYNIKDISNQNFKSKHNIYSIYDIPDYLATEISIESKFELLKTNLYNGYLIDLSPYENLQSYLNNKLGRASKSQIKRYKKRLDLCIAPEYKIYYGSIFKKEYDTIFETLISITKRRFQEKEEINFELPYLKLYQDIMFDLILKKKASIFVIYDRKKPINITLNFIEGKSLFHWNSCYDIDYSIFNLGHINMVNHLDWCYKNGIKIFDMGRGDFPHKRKYINKTYSYQEHLIYNSNNNISIISAYLNFYARKIKFIMIKSLKVIHFQKLYSKYAKIRYRLFTKKKTHPRITLVEEINELPNRKTLRKVNLETLSPLLIKPLNFFLHRGREVISNVEVFTVIDNENVCYFAGIKKRTKVIINNN